MFRIVTIVCVCVLSSAAFAQVNPTLTPEEAAQRLAEKQAARQKDRAQMVSITRGELEDMKAELARLRAEVARIHSAAAVASSPGGAGVRLVPKITVGTTKEEVLRFVQVKKATHEITRDAPLAVGAGQPNEEIVVTVKARRQVYVGVGSNGVNKTADYREEVRPDSTLTLRLLDGKVASVQEEKLPQRLDEINPLTGR